MPQDKGLVLIVEDEAHIADLERLYLTRDGFGVHVESDGRAGLAAVRQLRPVAIVLDLGLPGLDGVEFCRRLRDGGDWTPVLMVTARDEEADRIIGLELGADDYLTKPFSPRELAARVRTVLRRAAGPPGEPVLTIDDLTLDPSRRSVHLDGRPIELTTTEFNLLAYLMRHPGQVFSRAQLQAHVWGYADYRDGRVVDVYVSQLRGKLRGASPIRTVRGVGYSADPT
ncbi:MULTISPECIES: response regulator transcription factor [Streptomycetaceae]|uniref:response regulator transcription factor n=1 Tax=Streptomycetaceae TaxID=2062 RepID=UPI00035CD6C1|nr:MULTISPECIES: response regulator transcription factor [Streptomycetaceae]MYX37063.1 response regulator [Streptomyces sp. SID8377]